MEQDKISKILDLLRGMDERLEKVEAKLQEKEVFKEKPSESSIPKDKSFVEFYLEHKPKNETDKTLIIINFLEMARGIKSVTSKDITQAFREVREKPPINVSDKIQMLHKRGLIMPGELVDTMKSWTLTRSGLNYLETLKNE